MVRRDASFEVGQSIRNKRFTIAKISPARGTYCRLGPLVSPAHALGYLMVKRGSAGASPSRFVKRHSGARMVSCDGQFHQRLVTLFFGDVD